MRKARIMDRALHGLPLDGSDVARVSRSRRYVTYRHSWPDDVDGRVWDGVSRAGMRLAQRVADQTGSVVEVYSRSNNLLEQVEPTHE